MRMKMFECKECFVEFVMAGEDAAATEDLVCPVCQGDVRDEEESADEESS